MEAKISENLIGRLSGPLSKFCRFNKLPIICAVSAQMHQLFHNLISNALKFNNNNLPVIEISETAIDKDLAENSAISPEHYYTIKVKDNGIDFH